MRPDPGVPCSRRPRLGDHRVLEVDSGACRRSATCRTGWMARPSRSVAAAAVCIVGAVRLSWDSAHGPRRARRCAVGRTVVAHTRRACWVQAPAVPAIGRALRRAMAHEPAGPCLGAGSGRGGAAASMLMLDTRSRATRRRRVAPRVRAVSPGSRTGSGV